MEVRIIDRDLKKFIRYLVCIAVTVWIVLNVKSIVLLADHLFTISFPLILGAIMAYAINIIMKKMEDYWYPDSESQRVMKAKRPVCLFLSIFLMLAILFFVVRLVLPELVNAFVVIGQEIPIYFSKIQKWVVQNGELFPEISKEIGSLEVNWQELSRKVITYATSGVSTVLNSAVSIIVSVFGSIVNIAIALFFAIYILLSKEKLQNQCRMMEKAYLKEKASYRMNLFLDTAHDCFTSFITGQCVEAVILGILCTIGMFIFGFPYAPMVGTLIGATALIPIVGAYLGAIVGAFMIFTVAPMKTIGFLLFILILQQVEGNIIYPKVVGSSIGLPGMWVLASVTVGGGIAGIPGMLLGVPLAATVYHLLAHDVKERIKSHHEVEDIKETEELE
ncbi:MAG: AI-2E family transporter [Lachnospiraceae bacterium]|nr:AI-2E family transporter [Lachnospiraceae bacterium]